MGWSKQTGQSMQCICDIFLSSFHFKYPLFFFSLTPLSYIQAAFKVTDLLEYSAKQKSCSVDSSTIQDSECVKHPAIDIMAIKSYIMCACVCVCVTFLTFYA